MQTGETLTQYIYRVRIPTKQSMSAGENFKKLEKIRTILQGDPAKYFITRDLTRELKKKRREAIAMITAKNAELRASSSKLGSFFATKSHTKRAYTFRDRNPRDGKPRTP